MHPVTITIQGAPALTALQTDELIRFFSSQLAWKIKIVEDGQMRSGGEILPPPTPKEIATAYVATHMRLLSADFNAMIEGKTRLVMTSKVDKLTREKPFYQVRIRVYQGWVYFASGVDGIFRYSRLPLAKFLVNKRGQSPRTSLNYLLDHLTTEGHDVAILTETELILHMGWPSEGEDKPTSNRPPIGNKLRQLVEDGYYHIPREIDPPTPEQLKIMIVSYGLTLLSKEWEEGGFTILAIDHGEKSVEIVSAGTNGTARHTIMEIRHLLNLLDLSPKKKLNEAMVTLRGLIDIVEKNGQPVAHLPLEAALARLPLLSSPNSNLSKEHTHN